MLPANAYWLFSALLKIATFNFLPVEKFIDKFEEKLHLEHDNFSLSDTMADFGFDSSDPIRNLQIMFFFMGFLLLYPFMILLFCLIFCWSKRCNRCLLTINRTICWNVYIRFTLEAFLEISITCLLRFKVYSFESPSDVFHSSFATILVVILAVFWITLIVYLSLNQ